MKNLNEMMFARDRRQGESDGLAGRVNCYDNICNRDRATQDQIDAYNDGYRTGQSERSGPGGAAIAVVTVVGVGALLAWGFNKLFESSESGSANDRRNDTNPSPGRN